jgi:peptidoglycan hydrolase CwlO-like protein
MPSRKLDELATDVEDARRVVEELQDAPEVDTKDKLDELSEKLEQANDAIDDLEERTR